MYIYTEYEMPRNQLILPQIEAIPSRFLSLDSRIIVQLVSLLHAKVTVFFLGLFREERERERERERALR